ncbi:MAG: trimethylamine methyltransferase family protein [Chloroflexi bacterium]|nr:trimethylamine methyltransferase family protein [Chloroflexota bacterium]
MNKETMAVDLINEVGPGGDFLSTEHTLRHYKENWFPSLLDRWNYDQWEQNGKKTMSQRANEKVREILETYEPQPLPEAVSERIAEIVRRADQQHIS